MARCLIMLIMCFRSPSKMKKHGKPSFKFYKPKDKVCVTVTSHY